jgi:protein O-mannosyl-transferase
MSRYRASQWVLLVAAVVPFLAGLTGGFLNWDDPEYVPDNPVLRDAGGLAAIWTSFQSPQFYPMVFTTYWLEYRLWGLHPLGYHAVNIVCHAIATLLLFRFLRRIGIGSAVALACAGTFALHPTQAASVTWIAERKNVLSGVFYFASLLAFVKARVGQGRRFLYLSWVLGAAAMLSKTTTVTLPLAAGLVELWMRRATGNGADRSNAAGGDSRPASRASALLRLAPFAVLAVLTSALTVVREHGPAITSDLSTLDRVWVAGRAFWFYVTKLLVPAGLSGVYPRWDPRTLLTPGALSWIGILALAAVVVRTARRLPATVPFGLAQFAVAALPTSGIMPFGYMDKSFVADHFLYLPSWGFWLAFFSLVAWTFALVWHAGGTAAATSRATAGRGTRAILLRDPVLSLAAVMAVAFIPLTVRYSRTWTDSLVFWNHVLSHDPRSWLAYGNRGQWYASQGKTDLALADLRKALELKPDYIEATYNLGYVLDRMGRMDEARTAYEEALRLAPDNPDAHNNLGVLYMRAGDLARARREFERAASLDPADPAPRGNLRRLEAAERKAGSAAPGATE